MSSYSDYSNAVANLLASQGQVAARAAEQRGALWGNAISNIGQTIAQIPQTQALQEERQQRAQILQLQAQKYAQAQAAQAKANQVLANLPRQDDGTYDIGALTPLLAQSGVPLEMTESLVKSLDAMNGAIASSSKAKVNHASEAADALLKLETPDKPLTSESVQTFIAAGKQAGIVPPELEQQVTKAIASGADPKEALMLIRNKGEKFAGPEEYGTAAEGAVIYGKRSGVITGRSPSKKNTEAELEYDANDPNSPTRAISAAAVEAHKRSTKEANAQHVPFLLDGKPVEGSFLPDASGGKFMYNGEDVTGRAKPIPPASVMYPQLKSDKLIKVEHKDPETGRTVIEWLPQSEVRGQKFEKGVGSTLDARLASAQAVNQTGEDIIQKLKDPAYRKALGPALGRFNSIRDFIGNPPPEFAELAGSIESYSLANMGVHGMRSAQGAEQIKALLDKKHTPESLIATIQGLNAFSTHFMQNEGYGGAKTPSGPKPVGRYNPTTGKIEAVP